MFGKIRTVDDIRVKLEKYFEVMRWLPGIERPRCKTTNFYRVAIPPVNEEDALYMRPDITSRDISEAWYIDEHWMSPPLIYPNEYVFLRDFLSGLPKKELAYRCLLYTSDAADER